MESAVEKLDHDIEELKGEIEKVKNAVTPSDYDIERHSLDDHQLYNRIKGIENSIDIFLLTRPSR
jgi:peptidoglycan hydrolase CwlO-like protein